MVIHPSMKENHSISDSCSPYSARVHLFHPSCVSPLGVIETSVLFTIAQPAPSSPQKDVRVRNHVRHNSESSVMEMLADENSRVHRSVSSDRTTNPADITIQPADQSFSQDGVVPSCADAEKYFADARNFPGSPDMSMNWKESLSQARSVHPSEESSACNPSQNRNSRTPASRLPSRLTPRAKTPTGGRNLSDTSAKSGHSDLLNMTGERATVVISRFTTHPAPSDKELLPPPPPTVTKDLSHVGMADFAPPTPIGHHPRSPSRPSVAQQILGATRSATKVRSESVPPSNRISIHRSEAHININSEENHRVPSASKPSCESIHHSSQISQECNGILTNHQHHRSDKLNESRTTNHVRFNDHTQTKCFTEVLSTDDERSGFKSANSTPSPTTHDLVLDTSPDTTGRRVAPRAARRTAPSTSPGAMGLSDQVKKTLNFNGTDDGEKDMQVSYV